MYLPEKDEGWFVPLRPLFYTERGTPEKGSVFGIHPDGVAPGTRRCRYWRIFSGDYAKLLLLLGTRVVLARIWKVNIAAAA